MTLVTLAACAGSGGTNGRSSDEDAAVANMNLGAGYLRQGNVELAIERLRRALAQDPDLVLAHSTIAFAYDQVGSLEEAETHFRRATELDKEDGAAANAYAAFLCNRGNRWAEAEPYFRRAVQDLDYPTPEVAMTNAGFCARDAGDLAKAEENFRAALTRNPRYADALLNMVELSYQRADYLQTRAFTAALPRRPAGDGLRALDVLQRRARAQQCPGGRDVAPRSCAAASQARPSSRSSISSRGAMSDSEPLGPSPPVQKAPETLGQMLRSARLAQDLTVEQLSTELRIEAKQLNALEQNRFEQIGVPVFVKGYLKQYGLRLGLDVRDLLALYYKQTTLADVEIQPSRTIKLRDERQITSWILAAIVLLTLVVGLAVWWWSGGSFSTAWGTAKRARDLDAAGRRSRRAGDVAGRRTGRGAARADSAGRGSASRGAAARRAR